MQLKHRDKTLQISKYLLWTWNSLTCSLISASGKTAIWNFCCGVHVNPYGTAPPTEAETNKLELEQMQQLKKKNFTWIPFYESLSFFKHWSIWFTIPWDPSTTDFLIRNHWICNICESNYRLIYKPGTHMNQSLYLQRKGSKNHWNQPWTST